MPTDGVTYGAVVMPFTHSHTNANMAGAGQTVKKAEQEDVSRLFVSSGLRGGIRGRSHGEFLPRYVQCSEKEKDEVTFPIKSTALHGSLMECIALNIPQDSVISFSWDSPSSVAPIQEYSATPLALLPSQQPNKGDKSHHKHSSSPPPVLRTSIPLITPQLEVDPIRTHSMLVDKVNNILQDPPSYGISDEDVDDGSSENSEDEMVEDDDPDDMMTIVQYQSEAHREALIRKGSHAVQASQKQGRINIEGSGV